MSKYIYRIAFINKLHEAEGTQFQRYFGELMRICHPGFRDTRAPAFRGDGGNDGWIESEGAYYQVYGPEINSQKAEDHAIKKVTTDFEKLKEGWNDIVPIRKFFFVFNNRMQPISSELQKIMAKIKRVHELEEAGIVDTWQILDLFDSISEDRKKLIVGDLISVPEIEDLLSPLSTLVRKLANKNRDILGYLSVTHPDFSNKIKFNGLSDEIRGKMEYFSHFTSEIDSILKNSRGDAQDIVSPLKDLYQKSKEKIPDTMPDAPDVRYVWMVEELVQPEALDSSHYTSYRAAVEIIFAKYFESCDLYESPGSVSTS